MSSVLGGVGRGMTWVLSAIALIATAIQNAGLVGGKKEVIAVA
jgi:hypothetical protein